MPAFRSASAVLGPMAINCNRIIEEQLDQVSHDFMFLTLSRSVRWCNWREGIVNCTPEGLKNAM